MEVPSQVDPSSTAVVAPMTSDADGTRLTRSLKVAWRKYWRLVLFAVGLAAIGAIVRKVGPAIALGTLLSAGPFLPLLLLLEAGWMGMDVFVLRALLGDARTNAPWKAYAQSAVTAYSINILFPAGRASAEVTRATMLSPHLGGHRMALAAVKMQGVSLLGNSLITLCAMSVAIAELGTGNRLTWVLGTTALMTGSLGALILFGTRVPSLWAFLKKRIPRIPDIGEAARERSSLPRAIFLSFVARLIQGLLFTTVVYAVAGSFSLATGSIAQGISLVGTTMGDAVPQQAGVVESSFLYFAGALGLAATPAKAVSIALLVRVCQITLATMCTIVGFAWRPRPASDSSPVPRAVQ